MKSSSSKKLDPPAFTASQMKDEAEFRRDVRAFRAAREELLDQHEGEFVLVHAGRVVGLYPDEKAAFDAREQVCPNAPVIIKQLERIERVAYLPGAPMADSPS